MKTDRHSRRHSLKQMGAGAILLGASPALPVASDAKEETPAATAGGRIRQSVVQWCFKQMSVQELAAHAARMVLWSVELVRPEHWPKLKKLGLVCAITPSHGFAKGFAHPEEHAACLETLRRSIDQSAEVGFPSVITFSGFR